MVSAARDVAPFVPENEALDASGRRASTLISRNVTIHGHRTSMRLEPAMWEALAEIGRREKLNLHQLCSIVAEQKGEETSFTAAIRVFAMSYYRAAATEDGHSKAGHGSAFLFSAARDFAALNPRLNNNLVGEAYRPPAEAPRAAMPSYAGGRRY